MMEGTEGENFFTFVLIRTIYANVSHSGFFTIVVHGRLDEKTKVSYPCCRKLSSSVRYGLPVSPIFEWRFPIKYRPYRCLLIIDWSNSLLEYTCFIQKCQWDKRYAETNSSLVRKHGCVPMAPVSGHPSHCWYLVLVPAKGPVAWFSETGTQW